MNWVGILLGILIGLLASCHSLWIFIWGVLSDKGSFAELFGSILGASLGAIGAFVVSRKVLLFELNFKEKTEMRAILLSLKTELENILFLYNDIIVPSLNDGKEPVDNFFSITHNYFVIYDSLASNIGKIENDELRKTLINAYTLCKKITETISLHNHIYEKREKLQIQATEFEFSHNKTPPNPKNNIYGRWAEHYHAVLTTISETMLEQKKEFFEKIPILIDFLDNESKKILVKV